MTFCFGISIDRLADFQSISMESKFFTVWILYPQQQLQPAYIHENRLLFRNFNGSITWFSIYFPGIERCDLTFLRCLDLRPRRQLYPAYLSTQQSTLSVCPMNFCLGISMDRFLIYRLIEWNLHTGRRSTGHIGTVTVNCDFWLRGLMFEHPTSLRTLIPRGNHCWEGNYCLTPNLVERKLRFLSKCKVNCLITEGNRSLVTIYRQYCLINDWRSLCWIKADLY